MVGTIIIIAGLFVTASLIYAYVHVNATTRTIDEQTLCPLDGPDGLTVVMIDRTDPLSVIQQKDLERHLAQLKTSLPKRTAVEVYSIGAEQKELLTPEGSRLCNPGRSTDFSGISGNPRLAEKRWSERFSQPLDALFRRMVQSGNFPRSPIMEAIQSVGITAFGQLPERSSYRRLVIASDMLQNSPVLSQYREVLSFMQFKTRDSYRRVRTELRDVEVELWYIGGRSPRQGRRHVEFWQQFFADAGAKLVRVSMIQG